ncbi:MAG: hypothetical protein Q9P44_21065 [Anaerolineae bacterium]|nr:hypothetical protein [Anaerolineae bacterium]
MSDKRRILKPEDEMSREDYLKELADYTDEDAHILGYPNVQVLHLEDRLGQIAGKWRRTKDAKLVSEYRVTLYNMILKGYDVDTSTMPLNELDYRFSIF